MSNTQKNYDQGYRSNLNIEEKKFFRKKFCEKSTSKGIFYSSINLGAIYLASGIAFLAITQMASAVLASLVVLAMVLVMTRQMRALENIVHFGSHNNFCNSRAKNDLITNLFAAWPMLQDVAQYRIFHKTHHGDYGSHDDPCRARLERIGAIGVEISNNLQLIVAILRWMPSYVREFYNEVKSSWRQLVNFGIWHFLMSLILAVLVSPVFAIFASFMWATSMFLVLPFLRSIAEFSEHDYERGDTVRETTFNNLGLLDHALLHPAGDAWHALHHLHPTVPWWAQGAAHRFLMERDEAYRQAQHRDHLIQDIAHLPDAASSKTSGQHGLASGSSDVQFV
ncbi:MAG: fatty acid desaturase [Rhizobiaceae bacterium]